MRVVACLLGGLVVLASEGCYRYVPTTVETVSEGARVRAVLTPEAQQRLREIHQFDADGFEGTVVSRTGDRLSLLVSSGPMNAAFGARQVFYQQVDVGRGEIVRADIRQVDPFKTASLLAAGAAAVTAVIIASTSGGDPGTPPPTGNGPPESVRGWLILVPLLRW